MNEQTYLTELNNSQREAVAAPPGNLLVLAGAGSGKTRVLVSRIVWLLQNANIIPANIMAVTFTNKAANEMRSRLEKILNLSLSTMWVGTFHSLAHRLLRLHWQAAKLPQAFQIIDAEDQYRLLKRVHETLNLDNEKWPIKQSQGFINGKKEDGIRSNKMDGVHDIFTRTLIKVYQTYDEICERGGLIDFAELLLRAYELLQTNPELLNHYQNRFKQILVDEFQDTNGIQYAWIKLLTGGNSFLTAVGDDDQSIYGWRGAKIENIHRLSHDYSDLLTIRLEQNYRSTNNILTAANAVISNNINRLGKKLWTEDGEGELITTYSGYNEIDEARFIVERIKSHFNDGESLSDIAVLYRSNAQSRVLEERLIQGGIAYRIYGGLRFFDRAEIKDAVAYLRLLAAREDDAAFDRIINVPTRGIGEATLLIIRSNAEQAHCSLWEAAKAVQINGQLSVRASNAINNFLKLITEIADETKNLTLGELIEHVIFRSGLQEYFNKDQSESGKMRIENLGELANAARQYEAELEGTTETPALQSFLAQIALESSDDKSGAGEDCVQLMTLHAAKGLEFPIVFLCGMEQGLFPHHSYATDPNKLEEERRLCYVGMTRAMRKLYMTYAQLRRWQGSEAFRRPSVFLREIPEELVEGMTPIVTVNHSGKSASTPPTNSLAVQQDGGLRLGQQVSHQTFGEGTVINFAGSGEHLRVQVRFTKAGTKWLVAAYANLR
jgi:DNA helicase II / ATP-dependent DNA helicase PcrA